MAATIVTPDQDSVESEIFIAAPPQRVFQALTNPKQLMTWWTGECGAKIFELDPRRGGKWLYKNVDPNSSFNGVSNMKSEGEIIEYDPPRLLAYTWIANWHDDKNRRTVVRYELTPEEGGTNIKVTHSGLARELEARKGYAGGWPGVLEKLKQYTEQ